LPIRARRCSSSTELGLLDYYDLGYYLVCAKISDIASMGAQPVGLLSVVRYPPEMTDEEFEAVISGMRDACRRYGADLIGGDTGGAERLILSASALGVCAAGSALTRTGASPGDILCLTGAVGAPAAAVLYFSRLKGGECSSLGSDVEEQLLSSWTRPEPRVDQGNLLGQSALATTCQDVSDGLRATLRELSEASRGRFVIDAAAVPVDDAAIAVSRHLGLDPLGLALSASVDFELLFTVAPSRFAECSRAFKSSGLPLHEIGRVEKGDGIAMRDSTGELRDVPGVEWRHQKEDVVSVLDQGLERRKEDGEDAVR
jgi:thiamine-monophosphate kinase